MSSFTYQFRIVLEERFLRDTIALYLFDRSPELRAQSKIAVARPVVFETIDIANTMIDPALEISRDTAQQLFDELWRLGFRPAKEGSEGQLGAVERHLDDQRALSSKLLSLLERTIFLDPTITFGETRVSE